MLQKNVPPFQSWQLTRVVVVIPVPFIKNWTELRLWFWRRRRHCFECESLFQNQNTASGWSLHALIRVSVVQSNPKTQKSLTGLTTAPFGCKNSLKVAVFYKINEFVPPSHATYSQTTPCRSQLSGSISQLQFRIWITYASIITIFLD